MKLAELVSVVLAEFGMQGFTDKTELSYWPAQGEELFEVNNKTPPVLLSSDGSIRFL